MEYLVRPLSIFSSSANEFIALEIVVIGLCYIFCLFCIICSIVMLARGREAIYVTDKYLVVFTYKSYQKIPLKEIANVKANVGLLTTNSKLNSRDRMIYNSGQLLIVLKNSHIIDVKDIKDVLSVFECIGRIISRTAENNLL